MSGTYAVRIEAENGARWSSFEDPSGREWLWSRPEPRRFGSHVGAPFLDAGGLEECVPTINGEPDHGDAWSRPWQRVPEGLRLESDDYVLTRDVEVGEEGVVARYSLAARPGWRFLWAGHALLELGIGASVEAPRGHPVRIWPGHRLMLESRWPRPLGIPFDELGPDDGSATFLILVGLETVRVLDRGRRLRVDLHVSGQPFGFGLWRNLGGYPWDGSPTYRSIGVEPMLGLVPDLAQAGASEAATVPESGSLEWTLTLTTSAAGSGARSSSQQEESS